MIVKIVRESSSILVKAILKTLDQVIYPNRMNREEAIKILDIKPGFTSVDLDMKYNRIYNSNSERNKGSPYIQEKIKNAWLLLKEDFNLN